MGNNKARIIFIPVARHAPIQPADGAVAHKPGYSGFNL